MIALYDKQDVSSTYDHYFKVLDEILLKPNVKNPDLSIEGHLDILKTFAFNLFDMNCDNCVDELDLFQFMKNSKDDSFFQKVLMFDFKDIKRTLDCANEDIKRSDSVMTHHEDGTKRIKNLEGYIQVALKRKFDREKV